MWSVINKKDFSKFIDQYPELAEEQELYKLYETDDKIFLPRFFFKNYQSKFINLYNPEPHIERINLTFNGEPRDNQRPLIHTILSTYDRDQQINGIIKCYCGFGKTACSIYLATKLGMKTLFIVDKDSLYKQWVQEISKFTNITPEDIGIIKGNVFVVENKPFVVTTVQTLVSKIKRNPKEMYEKMKAAGFGLVIFDECHNTSASEMYSKSSILMSAPNIIGLSATPFKPGGQDILMKNVIGKILYDEANYKSIPEISFHLYHSGLTNYSKRMGFLDFVTAKAFYNKIITSSKTYMNLISKFVKEDMKAGHKTIVICWTEKQLQAISDRLTQDKIEHRQFYGKKREFSHDDKVLVVTYKYAGTGFDFKELSSLIYAAPLSGRVSLIQTAGRVLRDCEGKQQPKIRCLVDLSFPSQSYPEYKRAKKIFREEFQNVKIIDVEEE